jgi:hypothetical protein
MWIPNLQVLYDLGAPSASCSNSNVSYSHRVQDKDHYNYCVVPDSGADAILFISIAILASCVCSGQLSALYVLLLGAIPPSKHIIIDLHMLDVNLSSA